MTIRQFLIDKLPVLSLLFNKYIFRQKITFIGNQFQIKLIHLRFWSDGADFRTEAQKFFNARTMHTT